MDIPLFIFGVAMIGIGVIFAKIQISSYRKGLKDTFGSEIRLLITGIGFILCGVIVIVKAFSG